MWSELSGRGWRCDPGPWPQYKFPLLKSHSPQTGSSQPLSIALGLPGYSKGALCQTMVGSVAPTKRARTLAEYSEKLGDSTMKELLYPQAKPVPAKKDHQFEAWLMSVQTCLKSISSPQSPTPQSPPASPASPSSRRAGSPTLTEKQQMCKPLKKYLESDLSTQVGHTKQFWNGQTDELKDRKDWQTQSSPVVDSNTQIYLNTVRLPKYTYNYKWSQVILRYPKCIQSRFHWSHNLRGRMPFRSEWFWFRGEGDTSAHGESSSTRASPLHQDWSCGGPWRHTW